VKAAISIEELRRLSDSSCGAKKQKLRRARTVLSVGLIATAAALVPAQAGGGSTVKVNESSLRFDAADGLAATPVATVTPDGGAQIAVSIPPFIVVDATGSGAGWRVSLAVSNSVDTTTVTSTPDVSMSAPIVTAIGSSDLSNVVGNPLQGNVAIGEKIVAARADFGMGAYLVSPRMLTLAIPSISRRSTYVSRVTITLFTAP
jgi:hypothetical protein